MENTPLYVDSTIKPISSKSRRVLDLIEHKQPLSVYALALISEISYPTIARICRELEFCNLIKSRVEIGSNNKAVKILYIPQLQTKVEPSLVKNQGEALKINEVKKYV